MKYQALCFLGVLLIVEVAQAQPTPVGSEFVANTYTMHSQYLPDVATAANGSFVVVWIDTSGRDGSYFGIQGQRFDPDGAKTGNEFQINSTTLGFQQFPSVDMNDTGEFVVVWTHFYYLLGLPNTLQNSIRGQQFDSDGSPAGAELNINTFSPTWIPGGIQEIVSLPRVAMAPASPFIVAWRVQGPGPIDTQSWHVRGRLYDSDGNPLGNDFRANSYTTGAQLNPVVGMDANGQFTVVFEDGYFGYAGFSRDGSATGLFGQQFNADGSFRGSDFQINTTYTTGDQYEVAMAIDNSGNFVVSWSDGGLTGPNYDGYDGSEAGIFAKSFDSDHAPIGTEFQVNSDTSGSQRRSSVAFTGSFEVVWDSEHSSGTDNSYHSVQGRRFTNPPNSPPDSPLNSPCATTLDFQINSYTTYWQVHPRIAGNSKGQFVVVHDDYLFPNPPSMQDLDAAGSFGQVFFSPDIYSENFESGDASCATGLNP